MKALFFLVVCLASCTVAYDLAGAYERLFYYYAYLLDAQVNGGTPRKIAVKCRGKSSICTLSEFVKHITASKVFVEAEQDPVPLDFNISDDDRPPLDATAKKLFDNHITGGYLPFQILESVQMTDARGVQQLFSQISSFLVGQIPKTNDDTLKNPLRDSLRQVYRQRMLSSSNEAIRSLKKEWPSINILTRERELFEGSTETLAYLDAGATWEANMNLFTRKTFSTFLFSLEDEGHKKNLEIALKASEKISAACLG